MANTLVGVYDRFDEAQNAYNELLSCGFDRSDLQLSPSDESNDARQAALSSASMAGDDTSDHSFGAGIRRFFHDLFGGNDEYREHADVYAEAVRRGHYLVTVHTDNDEERVQATQVMNQFAPVDIDERVAGWRSRGWAGYDESAPSMSEAEISDERRYYETNSSATVPLAAGAPITGSGAAAAANASDATVADTSRRADMMSSGDATYSVRNTSADADADRYRDNANAMASTGSSGTGMAGTRDTFRTDDTTTSGDFGRTDDRAASTSLQNDTNLGADLTRSDTRFGDTSATNSASAFDSTTADIGSADMTSADTTRTDTTRADLIGADTTSAGIVGSDMSRADKVGADTTRGDMLGADGTGTSATAASDSFRSDLSSTSPQRYSASDTMGMNTAAGSTMTDRTSGEPSTTRLADTDMGMSRHDTTAASASPESRTIPVIQEELQIGKREVQRGGVRVFQRVRETPVNESVRLHEEHVHIERHPVDRPASEADLSAIQESSFEIRETAEEAVVGKTARIVEEVVVSKEGTERTQEIHDKVRRTDVEVEQLGAVEQGMSTSTFSGDDDFRQHFRTAYASDSDRFEDYEPAYRYGSTVAADERFRGHNWDESEEDVHADWESRYGSATPWEKAKNAVKYGWERATR